MKTKELIKKVKELGFEIIRAGSHIDIMFNDFIVAGVYTDQMHVMTFYSHEKLLLTNVDKLFNLLVEYTKTPVDEREGGMKIKLMNPYYEETIEVLEDLDYFNKSYENMLNGSTKSIKLTQINCANSKAGLDSDSEKLIFINPMRWAKVEVEK